MRLRFQFEGVEYTSTLFLGVEASEEEEGMMDLKLAVGDVFTPNWGCLVLSATMLPWGDPPEGAHGKIEFIRPHSEDFQPPLPSKGRLDVLVQLGVELLRWATSLGAAPLQSVTLLDVAGPTAMNLSLSPLKLLSGRADDTYGKYGFRSERLSRAAYAARPAALAATRFRDLHGQARAAVRAAVAPHRPNYNDTGATWGPLVASRLSGTQLALGGRAILEDVAGGFDHLKGPLALDWEAYAAYTSTHQVPRILSVEPAP